MKRIRLACMTVAGGLLFGCASAPQHSSNALQGPSVMDADAEYLSGKALHVRQRHDEARRAYLRALALDPSHVDALNGLAVLDASRGNLDQAIAQLEELARLRPELSYLHANLGHAYWLRKEPTKAIPELERALELNPDNQPAAARLAEIQRSQSAAASPAAGAAPDMAAAAAAGPEIRMLASGLYQLSYGATPPAQKADAVAAVPAEPMPAELTPAEPTPPLARVLVPAMPESAAQEPVPLAALTPPARPLAVELINGNGVTGLARGLRSLLTGAEWKVVRTANYDSYKVQYTRIEYAGELLPDARRFADSLGTVTQLRRNEHLQGSRLRVVLGHDIRNIGQLRQRLAAGQQQPAS